MISHELLRWWIRQQHRSYDMEDLQPFMFFQLFSVEVKAMIYLKSGNFFLSTEIWSIMHEIIHYYYFFLWVRREIALFFYYYLDCNPVTVLVEPAIKNIASLIIVTAL